MTTKKTSAPLEWWQVIELATVRQLSELRQSGNVAARQAANQRRADYLRGQAGVSR